MHEILSTSNITNDCRSTEVALLCRYADAHGPADLPAELVSPAREYAERAQEDRTWTCDCGAKNFAKRRWPARGRVGTALRSEPTARSFAK